MPRRLYIPSPCDAPWDEMTEAPGGRDCARCKTRVVDLTRLSEEDAYVVAASYKGSLCALLLSVAVSAGCSVPSQTPSSNPSTNVAPSTSGDTDGDGILDVDDKCPNDREDRDNFEDEDGCPDPDNDRDGIPDVDDKCPMEPETYNGMDDTDGCPDKGKVIIDPQGALPENEREEKLARILEAHPGLAKFFNNPS